MKHKLIKFICVLLAGAVMVSCNKDYDAEAEIAALEAEMDRLEQEDQHIREHFLERINSLRKRLTDLIAQTEAELIARIDAEGEALLARLNHKVAALKDKIIKEFNDTREYMDASFISCKGYIQDSFEKLDLSMEAIDDLIQDAISAQEEEKVKKLVALEGDIKGVVKRAEKIEATIGSLEGKLSDAEAFNKRLNDVARTMDDLDEAYAEMEKNQLDLMKMVEEKFTDEYFSSLSTAKLAEVKAAIAEAEDLIDEMETYKDDLENFAALADDMVGCMENLESDLSDAISEYDGLTTECEDALGNVMSIWEYFDGSDAEERLSQIQDLADSNNELYDDCLSKLDELEGHLDDYVSTVDDWHSQAHDYLQSCYHYGFEALQAFDELAEQL